MNPSFSEQPAKPGNKRPRPEQLPEEYEVRSQLGVLPDEVYYGSPALYYKDELLKVFEAQQQEVAHPLFPEGGFYRTTYPTIDDVVAFALEHQLKLKQEQDLDIGPEMG